jgi:hypothetical protein
MTQPAPRSFPTTRHGSESSELGGPWTRAAFPVPSGTTETEITPAPTLRTQRPHPCDRVICALT